jgi:hypothetical protein
VAQDAGERAGATRVGRVVVEVAAAVAGKIGCGSAMPMRSDASVLVCEITVPPWARYFA